jgi:hypothetical protein
MESDIDWVQNYLSQIMPRGKELVIRDPLEEDECRWFRAAVENRIIEVRQCVLECSIRKKRGQPAGDEFVVTKGRMRKPRHLFELSKDPEKPANFAREYLPHIGAYARLILEFGYNQALSSFSLYRQFSRDLIFKKAGAWYETDAEFYDSESGLYLHIEVKKSPKETKAVTQSLNLDGSLSGLSKSHAKELEYVLDLKPGYLWIVGPGTVEPGKHVYSVNVYGLNAEFTPLQQLPNPPKY